MQFSEFVGVCVVHLRQVASQERDAAVEQVIPALRPVLLGLQLAVSLFQKDYTVAGAEVGCHHF